MGSMKRRHLLVMLALILCLARAFFVQCALDDAAMISLRNLISEVKGMESEVATLVVCGDQGVGKSSVVSAIVKWFKLPFDEVTTSRCPVEIQMKPGSTQLSPLSVNVFLRFEYEYTDSVKGKRAITVDQVDYEKNIEAEMAKAVIRRAQKDILSVWKASDWHANRRAPKPLKFTRNTIVVEVFGATDYSLTLVDLPGLVHNSVHDEDLTGEESTHMIEMIKETTKDYIVEPHNIIVSIFTATNDYEVQIMAGLIRTVDPDFRRTIQVYTKANLAPPLAQQKIKDQLYGAMDTPLHFYVVITPPTTTYEDQRKLEVEFFASELWQDVTLHPKLKENLGMEGLAYKMSKMQAEQIRADLFAVRQEFEQVVARLKNDLRAYDEPPPDLYAFAKDKLLKFEHDLVNVLTSVGRHARHAKGTFGHEIETVFESFANAMGQSNQAVPLDRAEQEIVHLNTYSFSFVLPQFHFVRVPTERIFTDFYLKKWEGMADACLKDTTAKVKAFALAIAEKHFGALPSFFKAVCSELYLLVNEYLRTSSTQLGYIAKMNNAMPYTFQTDLMDQWEREHFTTHTDATLTGDVGKVLKRIRLEDANKVRAAVDVLFDIFTIRLGDQVPFTINIHLIQALADKLKTSHLEARLLPRDIPQNELAALFIRNDDDSKIVATLRRTLASYENLLVELKAA